MHWPEFELAVWRGRCEELLSVEFSDEEVAIETGVSPWLPPRILDDVVVGSCLLTVWSSAVVSLLTVWSSAVVS